jgi:hypothetical protein
VTGKQPVLAISCSTRCSGTHLCTATRTPVLIPSKGGMASVTVDAIPYE